MCKQSAGVYPLRDFSTFESAMLRSRALPLLTVLLLCSFPPASASTVHINSFTGNDSECSPTNSLVRTIPCRTIEHVISLLQGQSNVTIYIEEVIHLHQVLVFRSVSDIAIRGIRLAKQHHHVLAVVKCLGMAGFDVEDVHRFSMSNLELTNCSALEKQKGHMSALIFKMSSGIHLSNVTIANSYSSAVVFLNCYANIDIKKVSLYRNGHLHSCPLKAAGLLIENTELKQPGRYTLKDCLFHQNNNTNSCPKNENHNSTIQFRNSNLGGGMSIIIAGDCSNNSVILDHCNFTKNTAKWGAGLYIHFQDDTKNNTVNVTNCRFVRNRAYRAGGGVNIGFLNSKDLLYRTNMAYFKNTFFLTNFAQYGGGVAIFSIFGNVPYSTWSNVVFTNCSWNANRAIISPAVDISPLFGSNLNRKGFLPMPAFHDVDVTNHHIQNNKYKLKHTLHINSGVFLVTQFKVHFSGHVLFRSNSHSALQAVSSQIFIEPNTSVQFLRNGGANGAAVAMYGFSYISVFENTSFVFKNNSATNYGGGIYYSGIDQHVYLVGSSCFIEYNGPERIPVEERNITFIFEGNVAQSGGDWIYADSFLSCMHRCRAYYFVEHSICSITKCIGDFKCNESIQTKNDLVMSSGKMFKFADKNHSYSAIPGAMVNIPFNVTDDFNHPLYPLLGIKVSNTTSPIKISRQYMLSGDVYPIGPPNHSAKIEITVEDIRRISFQFQLHTLQCPPGFIYDNRTTVLSCVCGTEVLRKYPAVLSCNMTTFRAYMNKQYWAGYIPQSSQHYEDLYFAPCYSPICSTAISYLPSSPSELDQYICGDNHRRGFMCGKCQHNFSVYYHSRSFNCQHTNYCHFGIPFYFLSEILPVIVLFVVVVMFDLSFTSGNVVGFIFFCQYLSGLTVHANSVILFLKTPYRFFYGLFNLEYFTVEGLSYCLWKDFDIQDIIAFKFVTIVFALALVLMLITLLKTDRCKTLCRLRTRVCDKTSFVHGLSAFLVICYIQCSRTSFLLLKYVNPVGLNGKPAATFTYYGGLPYFRDKHLVYGILAIFSLLTVTVLPPLVLLIYPLSLQLLALCGVSEHWVVLKILSMFHFQKLIPFIDCFQSCYKDRYRFFAGLYFVYRVGLLLCFIVAESYSDLLFSLQIILLIFLGIHAMVQPYKERHHNVMDAFIFANLAIINALTITDFSIYQDYDKNTLVLPIIQLILLYLPMLACLTWFAWKLYRSNKRVDYERLEDDIDEEREEWSPSLQAGASSSEEHRNSRLYNYST